MTMTLDISYDDAHAAEDPQQAKREITDAVALLIAANGMFDTIVTESGFVVFESGRVRDVNGNTIGWWAPGDQR